MNNILKQTLTNMRQQPLLTGLTIAGTALAICLMMVVVMTREVQLVDYGNEPNRSRTLYVKNLHVATENGGQMYGTMTLRAANGIFADMKSPEYIALFCQGYGRVDTNMPGGDIVPLRAKAVNAAFFKVFSLDFIDGRPFTDEECQSNAPIALLSRSACRRLFGREDNVRGKTFMIAHHEYRAAGIVEDVSTMLKTAYSEIWVPMSTLLDMPHPLASAGINPQYNTHIAMMAKSADDFPAIRAETERMLAAYNKTLVPDTLHLIGQPDEQEAYVNRIWSFPGPDLDEIHKGYLIIFVILLIVPAINIASMTQSRLQQRREEIALRRTFGATRSTILWQTFAESLMQTLIAGVIGLLLCFVICYFAADFVFDKNRWTEADMTFTLDANVLFSPVLYGWALLFCLVLNTLSSIIPAWRASRGNIVDALK